jgi:hypothetical protein
MQANEVTERKSVPHPSGAFRKTVAEETVVKKSRLPVTDEHFSPAAAVAPFAPRLSGDPKQPCWPNVVSTGQPMS